MGGNCWFIYWKKLRFFFPSCGVLSRKGFSNKCTLRPAYFGRTWAAKFTQPLRPSPRGWNRPPLMMRKTRNKPICSNKLIVFATNSWSYIIIYMTTYVPTQEKLFIFCTMITQYVKQWRHVGMTSYLYLNFFMYLFSLNVFFKDWYQFLSTDSSSMRKTPTKLVRAAWCILIEA